MYLVYLATIFPKNFQYRSASILLANISQALAINRLLQTNPHNYKNREDSFIFNLVAGSGFEPLTFGL